MPLEVLLLGVFLARFAHSKARLQPLVVPVDVLLLQKPAFDLAALAALAAPVALAPVVPLVDAVDPAFAVRGRGACGR